MWLNYKTKPHLVEIFPEGYISEMIYCLEFALKYSRKKKKKGSKVDEQMKLDWENVMSC